MSPRQVRWLRLLVSNALGRHKLGHQCTVLDQQQVIREHFQVLFRILKQDPKILDDSTWMGALQRLKKSPQPWKIVSGPLAAGVQYLRDLGWNVDQRDTWKTPFSVLHVDPDDPWLGRKFGDLLNRSVQQLRRRAGRQKTAQEPAVQASWQGAILHSQNGGPAECQVCGQNNSLRHILWECPRWQGTRKFPSHLQVYFSQVWAKTAGRPGKFLKFHDLSRTPSSKSKRGAS